LRLAERGTIVSLVGQQFLGRGQRLQQRHGGIAIEALATAQEKAQRAAFAVYHRVDFTLAVQPPRLVPRAWSRPLFTPRRTVDFNGGAIDSNDVLP
jgi:hypothetical protein